MASEATNMTNETHGEVEANLYLVDFAYGVFIRDKELYAVLFALMIAAAVPLTVFVAASIIL